MYLVISLCCMNVLLYHKYRTLYFTQKKDLDSNFCYITDKRFLRR